MRTKASELGDEFHRIQRGELASSTQTRLRELAGWGGYTSFLEPHALAVAADAGVHPIGQVVGLSAGLILRGYVRTTQPGQGRIRAGVARWREHSGPVRSWNALRQRALARLAEQATLLGADAVIGVVAERELDAGSEGDLAHGQMRFSGTAVRVDAWRHATRPPVLTLATASELWSMLRCGIEPAGIAGAFASVETLPSTTTVMATSRRWTTPSLELEDLTKAVYEVRRLALERIVADAGKLGADGLLGIELVLEGADFQRVRPPAMALSVHVLASAIRRVAPSPVRPEQVLAVSGGPRD